MTIIQTLIGRVRDPEQFGADGKTAFLNGMETYFNADPLVVALKLHHATSVDETFHVAHGQHRCSFQCL